jgi:hypothetical protein
VRATAHGYSDGLFTGVTGTCEISVTFISASYLFPRNERVMTDVRWRRVRHNQLVAQHLDNASRSGHATSVPAVRAWRIGPATDQGSVSPEHAVATRVHRGLDAICG